MGADPGESTRHHPTRPGDLLGQYQSIIVAELDGPRERRLQLQIVGE
jgi:thiamine phosphate synthase YjbQ (UPF0047 family)